MLGVGAARLRGTGAHWTFCLRELKSWLQGSAERQLLQLAGQRCIHASAPLPQLHPSKDQAGGSLGAIRAGARAGIKVPALHQCGNLAARQVCRMKTLAVMSANDHICRLLLWATLSARCGCRCRDIKCMHWSQLHPATGDSPTAPTVVLASPSPLWSSTTHTSLQADMRSVGTAATEAARRHTELWSCTTCTGLQDEAVGQLVSAAACAPLHGGAVVPSSSCRPATWPPLGRH